MGQIRLIIHGKLNFFLSPKWKDRPIEYRFDEKVALKHILESLGIPHPEVGSTRINEQEIDLSYHVRDQDEIDVYPYDPRANHLPVENVRFILDNNLGKLNDYLRLLGFDTLYDPEWEDQTIAEQAGLQGRILLTRDRGLLKRKIIRLGYCVRADQPREQVSEVIEHFGLVKSVRPFRRCVHCNGLLISVHKAQIIEQLQPLTRLYYNEFMRCSDCGQIYWKGSHYDHMQEFITKFSPNDRQEDR
jgi:hypothetical protein